MSTALPILLLLIGLLVGAVAGYALAVARSATARAGGRDEAAALRAEAAQWRARAEELTARTVAAEERAERDGSVLRALAPVRSQLEQVGARVERMEQQRAAEHATLTEQLRAGAESDRELRRTTTALEGALRSRSSRGLWGEVELARVLEASGMMRHIDFSEQRSVASVVGRRSGAGGSGGASGKARPDVVVHLPGNGFLALDAKVPLDSYLKACAVGADPDGATADGAAAPGGPTTDGAHCGTATQERRARLLAEHAKALRAHVDALAERHYARTLQDSPELVVLFVPAEPILAAALEADPTLMEHALDHGVALTTPASLLALLRTCAIAWARTAVNDDARELVELGRTLYERLGTVARHLDTLGSALTRSVTAYNQAVGSMESRLLVTARSFETLGDDLTTPRQVSPDNAQVRRFASAELAAASE
ncbi:DNA recombination protein RmuC [Actinomyces succiniciruminis]|uniref:DNA recombination protein RmuC protein n=1 Tax=Actinomyces succiniciruminis TaxID=1522002 RepID=A0A1L7RQR2_9ACTO|nr:DNA recombination protein RmuC [Actinomyces succiniciruminis]CED92620.1 DNA recombination protein RmuC protein [Actinomyces succiniciruminis]